METTNILECSYKQTFNSTEPADYGHRWNISMFINDSVKHGVHEEYFTPLGLHTNTDMRELISVQGWRTEREVVVTGCIDATKTHNLAAKCHDTRSVVHVTRYLCNTTTRGHVSLRHVDMSHWDNTRSAVHVTRYLCNTAHHVTTTATRGHVSLRHVDMSHSEG